MGKSKKTRWRTLSLGGSRDESNSDGTDTKLVNGTGTQYSQILGDHHINSSNSLSSKTSSNDTHKLRNYNKENYYNQRSQKSWQRGGFRAPLLNGKEKRTDLNGNNKTPAPTSTADKIEQPTEPIKFNEDEYTRITTPRQDVLFKKGYLSRMNNNNKTATPTPPSTINSNNISTSTTIANSTESTAASSTITTSDPDSSVSTLSPATTPSMDYGNMDSMEFAPMYYPGYYDESGMLMIPMYNSYNYGSSSSPVFLMPYPPYPQYDPFFMAPGSDVTPTTDAGEPNGEKTEADGEKESNQSAESQNGTQTSSSSEDGANSNHGEEIKSRQGDQVNEPSDNTSNDSHIVSGQSTEKTNAIPAYPNELGGFIYPAATYPNGGYYNNFYYYNGGGQPSRPPKMRRRKRFLNSRNSHSQHHSAAETTTDYSDDDSNTHYKRFNGRHYHNNGWTAHHNGHNNQYHYNGKFQRNRMEQNVPQPPQASNLNVDVQEFIPRIQSVQETTETVCDASDLHQKEPSPKPKTIVELPPSSKVTKSASHPSKPSKKEIIEGIKSMEQQNINLAATKIQKTVPINSDVEWNVIKKGKKVKIIKDTKANATVPEVKKDAVEEMKESEPTMVESFVPLTESLKKSPSAQIKAKKPKNKNKKKKTSHLTAKQDGFQIIEPEFGAASYETQSDETTDVHEVFDDDQNVTKLEIVETVITEMSSEMHSVKIDVIQEVRESIIEPTVEQDEAQELIKEEETKSTVKVESYLNAQEFGALEVTHEAKLSIEPEEIKPEIAESQPVGTTESIEKIPEESLPTIDDDDAIIDISDEDICYQSSIPIEMAIALETEELKIAQSEEHIVKSNQATSSSLKLDIKKAKSDPKEMPATSFQDEEYFKDCTNIAALERDLMENLKLLDDEIELKSPIINPLHDFPITKAVRKWLQDKESESFDSLFHVPNLKKLRELHDESDDDSSSDISDGPAKSDTDSDYASDVQLKGNGSPVSRTKVDAKTLKCNKLIAKESFCALM